MDTRPLLPDISGDSRGPKQDRPVPAPKAAELISPGDQDACFDKLRRVHAVHKHIQGELTEGSGAFAEGSYYQANEAHAMLWVHATLWDNPGGQVRARAACTHAGGVRGL